MPDPSPPPIDEAQEVPAAEPAPDGANTEGPEAPNGDSERQRTRDFEEAARQLFERLRLDPEQVDESLRQLSEKARALYDQGRYTKVRVSYKGKPLGPDIPMTALLAGEVLSFWLAGPLRLFVMNLGVKSFLDVEVVHEADGVVRRGVERFNEGEAEEAERLYREALRMKPGDTAALYNLGVLLRVSGRKEEALGCFQKAATDEQHPDGARAREAVARMQR